MAESCFIDYDETLVANEIVFLCQSKLSILLNDNQIYKDGRCMITNNYIVWRNIPNSKTETTRVLLKLQHILPSSITSKTSRVGKSSVNLYLKQSSSTKSNNISKIQLTFKNVGDSFQSFFNQLQSLVQNDDDQKEDTDQYETLINIVKRENILDDVYINYKSMSQFISKITPKLASDSHLSSVIFDKVLAGYDDKTHHLKAYNTLSSEEQSILAKLWFNHMPYIKLTDYKKHATGKVYLEWMVFNFIMCRLSTCYDGLLIDTSSEVKRKWIEQMLKCTWYYEKDEVDTNKMCTDLLDIWMRQIWKIEWLEMDGIIFKSYDNDDELTYDNLFVIRHLFQNYTKLSHSPKIDLTFVMLTSAYPRSTYTKIKGYDQCFIDILNIDTMEWNDADNFDKHLPEIHAFMIELLCKYGRSTNHLIIKELRNWIKNNKGYDNCYQKNYRCLHLQNHLKDDSLSQTDIIKIIENILLIDMDYLESSWQGLYYGYDPLKYCKQGTNSDSKRDKVVQYIQHRIEMGPKYDNNLSADFDDDDSKSSPRSMSKSKPSRSINSEPSTPKKQKPKRLRPKKNFKKILSRITTPTTPKTPTIPASYNYDDCNPDRSIERRKTAPASLFPYPITDSITQQTEPEESNDNEVSPAPSQSYDVYHDTQLMAEVEPEPLISTKKKRRRYAQRGKRKDSRRKNKSDKIYIDQKRRAEKLKAIVAKHEKSDSGSIKSPPPIALPNTPPPYIGVSGYSGYNVPIIREDEDTDDETIMSMPSESFSRKFGKVDDAMAELLQNKMMIDGDIEIEPLMVKSKRKNGKSELFKNKRVVQFGKSLPSTPERRRSSRQNLAKLKAVLKVDRLNNDINKFGKTVKQNDARIDALEKKLKHAQNQILLMKTKMEENEKKNEGEEMIDGELEKNLLNGNGVNTENWRGWTYLDIIQWIIVLEQGRFSKYKQVLYKKMKSRNMKGEYLMKMEKIDLETFFGINDFGDICDLWQYVKGLISEDIGSNKSDNYRINGTDGNINDDKQNTNTNENENENENVNINPLELQDSVASASMFADHEVDDILEDIMKSENEKNNH